MNLLTVKSLVDRLAKSLDLVYIYLGILENTGMISPKPVGLMTDIAHRTSILNTLSPIIDGRHSTVDPGSICSSVSTFTMAKYEESQNFVGSYYLHTSLENFVVMLRVNCP